MKWFFKKLDVWKIGPFQLENIIQNSGHFFLFDLREPKVLLEEEELLFAPFLSGARRLPPELVKSSLSELSAGLDSPVILVCQNGRVSSKVAKDLGAHGYVNIYVLEGGVKSLRTFIESGV
ncbi:MAG: rhodanese-like domain-containing protein [Bdellovibrionales bacterium]|nr:rhodanese-like domain-containing protein [Bdellovibrionales bacterium]